MGTQTLFPSSPTVFTGTATLPWGPPPPPPREGAGVKGVDILPTTEEVSWGEGDGTWRPLTRGVGRSPGRRD